MEESISRSSQSKNQGNDASDTERWASLIGGGAMVLTGLRDRSLRGILLTLAGGGLAYHGATAEKSLPDRVADATGLNNTIRAEKSVTIQNKSPEELYSNNIAAKTLMLGTLTP